jgi:hypothetical protein
MAGTTLAEISKTMRGVFAILATRPGGAEV